MPGIAVGEPGFSTAVEHRILGADKGRGAGCFREKFLRAIESENCSRKFCRNTRQFRNSIPLMLGGLNHPHCVYNIQFGPDKAVLRDIGQASYLLKRAVGVALSSICPACGRLTAWLSCSGAVSRLASSIYRPPSFAFNLYGAPSDTACFVEIGHLLTRFAF
jgi:hypothetical protein